MIKKFLQKFSKKFKTTIKIIDVGARTGLESNLLVLSENSMTKILGFEPEPDEFHKLSKNTPSNVTILNTALYSSQKEINLYVTNNPGLSSIYKPNFDLLSQLELKNNLDQYRVVKKIKFLASTLDNEAYSNNFEDADFIKIDTEGSEVDILKGAENLLKSSILGLESEISYTQQREGQFTFKDLTGLLDEFDFHIFDVRNKHQKRESGQRFGKRKGQLVYCDALFFKSIKGINELILNKSKNEKKYKICRSILIVSSYGYFDYAYEIFSSFKELFNEEELKFIEKVFKKSESIISKLPHFPGRGFVGLLFYKIGIFMGAGKWDNRSSNRFGENFLGNIDWW